MTDRPITRARRGGYVLRVAVEERQLISRLLAELRMLLLQPPDDDAAGGVMARLFPTVHPDDAAQEAEYQRLMRDELVASRLEAINVVDAKLAEPGRKVTFDEEQLGAFMQAVNAVRLVLGTLLDVSEDDDSERRRPSARARAAPVSLPVVDPRQRRDRAVRRQLALERPGCECERRPPDPVDAAHSSGVYGWEVSSCGLVPAATSAPSA